MAWNGPDHELGRRKVLAGLGAALLPLSGLMPLRPARAAASDGFRYLSCRADGDGGFHASVFSETGAALRDVMLPARGHGGAYSTPRREWVMFGRRPGTYALVFPEAGQDAGRMIDAAPGRWFAGHGVFTPDGKRLYAVEGSREGGRLGIYDTERGYARVGEIATGGIGPHQLVLMPDGHTVAVCNGGIRTDPDFPRAKLNLATMKPSLALVDLDAGRVAATARLPEKLHQLSIRHLDVAGDGTLAIGLQYQGPKGDVVPLAMTCRGGELVPLDMGLDTDETPRRALWQYVGSIAFDAGGRVIAATSPVGGAVVFWRAGDGKYLRRVALADVCGLGAAGAPGIFVVTTGRGGIYRVDANGGPTERLDNGFGAGAWDNHLQRVPAAGAGRT